ncbi:hypothetical protein J1N35_041868, partial [Gossypium stocksii]
MEKALIYSAWLYEHRPCTKGRTTHTSHCEDTPYVKRDFDRWDRSNCMSLMIMKHHISEAFWGTESEKVTHANVFLTKLRNVLLKTI